MKALLSNSSSERTATDTCPRISMGPICIIVHTQLTANIHTYLGSYRLYGSRPATWRSIIQIRKRIYPERSRSYNRIDYLSEVRKLFIRGWVFVTAKKLLLLLAANLVTSVLSLPVISYLLKFALLLVISYLYHSNSRLSTQQQQVVVVLVVNLQVLHKQNAHYKRDKKWKTNDTTTERNRVPFSFLRRHDRVNKKKNAHNIIIREDRENRRTKNYFINRRRKQGKPNKAQQRQQAAPVVQQFVLVR